MNSEGLIDRGSLSRLRGGSRQIRLPRWRLLESKLRETSTMAPFLTWTQVMVAAYCEQLLQ